MLGEKAKKDNGERKDKEKNWDSKERMKMN